MNQMRRLKLIWSFVRKYRGKEDLFPAKNDVDLAFRPNKANSSIELCCNKANKHVFHHSELV